MSSPQAIDVLESFWSSEKIATVRIQKYCDEIRNDIEEKMNRKLMDFIAIRYIVKENLFDGAPYIVKIHDSGEVCIHAKFSVFLTREGEKLTVKEVQDNKKEEELIVPF